MRENLRAVNERNVLVLKADTVSQIDKLTGPFQPNILIPSAETDIIFSDSSSSSSSCARHGHIVLTKFLPDPSKCYVTGTGTREAAVAKKCRLILQVINCEGDPCKESIKSLDCELVSEITGTRARCGIQKKGTGKYKISYQPTIKGRHWLHVKVDRGSPFDVVVVAPSYPDAPIRTVGGVVGPWGVATTRRGEFSSGRMGDHCVSIFGPSGEKLRSFGSEGSGHGQFLFPRGVVVDFKENIVLADSENHRIQKFTEEGQFFEPIGTQGSGLLQFSFPTDIALNASNGKLYVTDTGNDRVQVLNSDLTFSCTFGRKGSDKGQFNTPWGIACDSTGMVYVADCENHRIQVFTEKGKFLRTFGKRGQHRGELHSPIGVAIGANNTVYVSEDGNHCVSAFTSEGRPVTQFGMMGEGRGEFKWPSGIAVDNSGVVYVCDRGNDRLQMF